MADGSAPDIDGEASAPPTDPSLGDLLGIDIGWTCAFILGAIVILFFAKEQLNRPLGEEPTAQRRARLLEAVAPEQLRSGRIFFRGYLFYSGFLLLLFALFSLGGASLIQLLVPPSAGNTFSAQLDGASAPLLVALAIVGLMPSTPLLDRIERRVRELAFRIVGIPGNFNEFTDALIKAKLDPDMLSEEVIGPAERGRMAEALAAARSGLGDGPHFRRLAQSIAKLYAVRGWSAAGHSWPGWTVRYEFRRLEIDILPAIDVVLEDLHDLAERERPAHKDARAQGDPEETASGKRAARSTAAAPSVGVASETRWRALAERANAVAEDACALIALYAERADRRPKADPPILKVIRDLVERADAERSGSAPQFDVLARALLLLALAMFVVGALGQASDINPYPEATPFGAGLRWALGVLVLFGPASFMAWSARLKARDRSDWRNAFADRDVFPTLQYSSLALSSYIVAALSMMTYLIFMVMLGHIASAKQAGSDVDFAVVMDQFLRFEQGGQIGGFWQALLFAPMGAFHAVMLALLQDHVAARREGSATGLIGLHGAGLAVLYLVAVVSSGRYALAADADELRAGASRAADDHIEKIVALATPEADAIALAPEIAREIRAAAASARRPWLARNEPASADFAAGLAALKAASAAGQASPELAETAAAALVAADPGATYESALAQIRLGETNDGGVTFAALHGLWYEALSAAAFGWLSAWLMVGSLQRLRSLRMVARERV